MREIERSREERRLPVRGRDRINLIPYEGGVFAVLLMAAAIGQPVLATFVLERARMG